MFSIGAETFFTNTHLNLEYRIKEIFVDNLGNKLMNEIFSEETYSKRREAIIQLDNYSKLFTTGKFKLDFRYPDEVKLWRSWDHVHQYAVDRTVIKFTQLDYGLPEMIEIIENFEIDSKASGRLPARELLILKSAIFYREELERLNGN